jgi:hypothetical protein
MGHGRDEKVNKTLVGKPEILDVRGWIILKLPLKNEGVRI